MDLYSLVCVQYSASRVSSQYGKMVLKALRECPYKIAGVFY